MLPEVRQSIEAKGQDTEDVEMRDGSEDGRSEVAEGDRSTPDSKSLLGLIQEITSYLCKIEEDGELLAGGFQRIPNKRVLPDYYDVITVPVAFSTVRGKLLRKLYSNFGEFVRDVSQICHNAQVYNRPSAPIFGAAERLRSKFRQRLQKLAEDGRISKSDAILPDLGEIPDAEDSPLLGSEDEDDEDIEEDEDEDGEDEEEGDSEDASGRRKRAFRGSGRSQRPKLDDDDKDDDTNKKRGRPPSVLTPLEARIHNLLRGLRKPKDENGNLQILPFERLPDKAVLPDYYNTVPNPIALDQIKRKAKRKKYPSVDHAMSDVELMFENAKRYNEDGSPVFEAAVLLQHVARTIAAREKAKSDDDFRDEDGKLPLSEILHGGQIWRVGDWVHIRNPNDVAKPIVAQIYRTWQDPAGQIWINACWYYRPEQTVHRFDKHFYEREVVKTGQYRDHQIEDVLDHCFVMFVTRFPKGRPVGISPNKDVYVCESRYNEEKYRFNKIKTWASCVPDEVREKDYEMDFFDVPRRMRKVPSPIKHLLRDDSKETDGLPRPTWGSSNAPPIVGAVHRRPRESHESPPPEPSQPQSQPALHPHNPADVHRRPPVHSGAASFSSDHHGRRTSSPFANRLSAASPGQASVRAPNHFPPVTPGTANTVASLQTPTTYARHTSQNLPAQGLQQSLSRHRFQNHYPQQYAAQPTVPLPQQPPNSATAAYGQYQAPQFLNRASITSVNGNGTLPPNSYTPPRPSDVYTLTDVLHEALSQQVRGSFQADRQGRTLFFTAPPYAIGGEATSAETAEIGHSARYLAGRAAWLAERHGKRKQRDNNDTSSQVLKSPGSAAMEDWAGEITSQAAVAVNTWFQRTETDTDRWQDQAGLLGRTEAATRRPRAI